MNRNRPYTICHMMMSVDGRIDCDMTEKIDPTNDYYDALGKLKCPSLLMGRVTMQMHYASPELFTSVDKEPIGTEIYQRFGNHDAYTIGVDTKGRLRWPANEFDGGLLVITSESAPKAYIEYLRSQQISFIATGHDKIDMHRAMELLFDEFGVKRLALTGGGHINGALLGEGLIDEFSIIIAPGIDGREGMVSVFDGMPHSGESPYRLELTSVEQLNCGNVWLRYRPASNEMTI